MQEAKPARRAKGKERIRSRLRPPPPGGEGTGEGGEACPLAQEQAGYPEQFPPTPALPHEGGGRENVCGLVPLWRGNRKMANRSPPPPGRGGLGWGPGHGLPRPRSHPLPPLRVNDALRRPPPARGRRKRPRGECPAGLPPTGERGELPGPSCRAGRGGAVSGPTSRKGRGKDRGHGLSETEQGGSRRA